MTLSYVPRGPPVPEQERRLGNGSVWRGRSVTASRVDTAQVRPVPDRAASARTAHPPAYYGDARPAGADDIAVPA